MSDKETTQAMPSDGRKGAPDGTNAPQMMEDGRPSGGDGNGGPYPNQPKHGNDGKDFRGGQTEAAYHGTGQLGEKDVTKGGNANAGAKEP